MITNNVSTLKIHKLTQEQYDHALAAGNIDENALYLTPDETLDSAKEYMDTEIAKIAEEISTIKSDISNINSKLDVLTEEVSAILEHLTNGSVSNDSIDKIF